MPSAPRITATLGLPGSASTWVFNVARELVIAQHGANAVHSVFSDQVQPVLEDAHAQQRYIVWKLHQPEPNWQSFARQMQAKIILSLRDPRDAMLSLMRRFNYDVAEACGTMRRSLRSIEELAKDGHPVLRYEDRFFERPVTVGAIAGHIGVALGDAERARIFATYETETVRQFGRRLDSLPPERIKTIEGSTRYDAVTQIHGGHIGDQRIGKWREEFDHTQRRTVTALLSPWLQTLGYDAE